MSTKARLPLKLSIVHIWPLAVLIGIFVFLSTHPIRPHDFWWHMAAGRQVIISGHIPTVDTHSSTAAGTPYPAYQVYWLAESVLYLIYRLGGPALIVFAHSLIVTTAYALTLWVCHRITQDWRIAALATLSAAALGISDWNVRPQAFTFWLAPVFLLVIQAYCQTPRRSLLAIFPLGMMIWANCHGSFFIGLLLIGLWLAHEMMATLGALISREKDRPRDRLTGAATALATAALACLVNPRGIGIVTYVRDLTSSSVVQKLVPEWAPPTFSDLSGSLFLFSLLGLAGVLALSPKRPSVFQLMSFFGFALLGLRTMRGAIWFGLVMAPVLADHAAALTRRHGVFQSALPARGSATANAIFVALLLLSAVIALPWFKEFLPLPQAKAGLISQETPTKATEFLLTETPPGPIYNDIAFGSYLAWIAQPEYPVFVDPRIELYTLELWLDYLHIGAAQCGWEQKLAKYGIQTLMLSPAQYALIDAALATTEWSEIYTDSAAVILTRATGN